MQRSGSLQSGELQSSLNYSSKLTQSSTFSGDDFKDLSQVTLIADPSRELYAAFGVGTLPWSGLFSTIILGPLKELAGKGIKNRETWAKSNRWQNSAAFAIKIGGEVKWVHVAEHAGDMSDMEAAARTLRA